MLSADPASRIVGFHADTAAVDVTHVPRKGAQPGQRRNSRSGDVCPEIGAADAQWFEVRARLAAAEPCNAMVLVSPRLTGIRQTAV